MSSNKGTKTFVRVETDLLIKEHKYKHENGEIQ